MGDPYIILGVSPTASDEEIKNAYREKARQAQAGFDADAKMRELDSAYDEIMAKRRGSYGSGNYSSYSGYNSSPTYGEIRNKIKRGQLDEAQNMLNSIPASARIAEWFYLQGMIQQQKGWTNAAYENFENAYRMDPTNGEYTTAYQSMNSNRSGGYRTSNNNGSGSGSGCSACEICQGLICADCCCECMGGDLIRCC